MFQHIDTAFKNCHRCKFFDLGKETLVMKSMGGDACYHEFYCKNKDLCLNALEIAKIDEVEE